MNAWGMDYSWLVLYRKQGGRNAKLLIPASWWHVPLSSEDGPSIPYTTICCFGYWKVVKNKFEDWGESSIMQFWAVWAYPIIIFSASLSYLESRRFLKKKKVWSSEFDMVVCIFLRQYDPDWRSEARVISSNWQI